MTASKAARGITDPATESTGTASVGNPGVLIGTQDVGGQLYARYRAVSGTWVSSSLQEQGYARLYGRNTGYGAYTGLVRSSDGTALTNADRIRPGQEFLVPVLPAAQPVPGRTEASPWTTGLFANVEASRGTENRYGGSQPVTTTPLPTGAAELVEEIEAVPATDIGRQWKDKRGKFLAVAYDSKNNLNGNQLFQIWLQFWMEQLSKALADEKAARTKVWSRDNVEYANNMNLFQLGKRDALGPEYQEAADRVDAARSHLSCDMELHNWLETRVDVAHDHLTLVKIEYKALEIAKGRAQFQKWIEPVLFAILGWAASAPRSPSRAPTRDPESIGEKNVPVPVPRPATVRPFLTADAIKEMLARRVKVLTWRTRKPDVVKNQAITWQEETNPYFGEKVALMEGFEGVDYGPYHMVIEMDKVPRLYPHPASPGEYYTPDPIPANEGYWTTSEEVAKAFGNK
jgi:hypothetical protein